MTKVHHLSCGSMQAAGGPYAVSHCLLLEDRKGLALVDTGTGLLEVRDPAGRLGQELIDIVGFKFIEADTAIRQIERMGFGEGDLKHIVLTHGDPDHAGGLADFPEAAVHVSAEELANVRRGSWRYVPRQFEHGPRWVTYERPGERWFGVEARPVDLGIASRVLFICLPGHTFGHCGVAIEREDGRWLLHAGDAYYLRVETERDDHPVSKLAAQRADDNSQRLASLGEIRRLLREHGDRIEIFGYHDPGELQL